MPVFNDADDVRLGSIGADKVYLGSDVVWTPPTAAGYDTEVLADSPWAYWRMEETSGTTLADETGNGRDATNNGGDLTAVGQHGSAVQLDGTNDYIDVGSLPFWSNIGSTGLTIEFWFKSSTTTQDLLWGIFNNSDDQGMQVWVNSGEAGSSEPGGLYMQFRVGTDAPDQDLMEVLNTGLFDGNWHHFALTRGAGSGPPYNLYVDGVSKSINVYNQGTFTNWGSWQHPVTFGARNLRGTVDSFLDCHMDELALYDSVLSQTRVQAHYNA